jgi:hypothetical protein
VASLNDILRIVPTIEMGVGVTVQNVYYCKVTQAGGIDDGDVLDDMGDWMDDVYTPVQLAMPDDATFEEIKITNVTADVDIGTTSFPTLTQGNASGEPYAPGVAGLVLAFTDKLRHTGRKFFGPFNEGSLTNGLFSTLNVGRMVDAAVEAYTPFTGTSGGTYQPVIVDRTTGEGRGVTSVQATSNPAYQRRRRLGRGI